MALQQVIVEIENVAPPNGTNQTPFWVGFHNGFDTFDSGQPASPGLESLAEDGSTSSLSDEFAASGQGQVDGTVGEAPLAPGDTAKLRFVIDTSSGDARYFSFASMVLPSNDTFIGNENEFTYELFDENGNFIPQDIIVPGTAAYDAGTEINDELPENTAFFGQQAPNTGEDQNEGVQLATGFNPRGSGGILDAPQFAGGDYTAAGYEFVRIRVTAGRSVILGTAEDDILTGTSANERIQGGRGDDILTGSDGSDQILGGKGSDVIFGDRGRDFLFGGIGDYNDVLSGGAGKDRFRLAANTGTDVILDFEVNRDKLVIAENVTFGQLELNQKGDLATIGLEESGPIAVLKNVNVNKLTANDFVLLG